MLEYITIHNNIAKICKGKTGRNEDATKFGVEQLGRKPNNNNRRSGNGHTGHLHYEVPRQAM